jgi:hypothetical protein
MTIVEIFPTTASIYFIASSSVDSIHYGEVLTGSICYTSRDNVNQYQDFDVYANALATYGIDPVSGQVCFSGSTLEFYNTGSYGYMISSAFNPCIQLERCMSYSLYVNTPGQPLYIKSIDLLGNISVYNDGVTNNGTDNGTITFNVPGNAPDGLIYVSDNSEGMLGNISVIGSGEACYVAPSPTPTVTPTVTPSLTPSVSPSAGSVRVHVLGDTDVATVASTISSHLSGRGYTANVTSQVLGTTYTGADLSTSLYDVVVMYTN